MATSTSYKVKHIASGRLSETGYPTVKAAVDALHVAAAHVSDFEIVPVVVCDHPDPELLSPCCYVHMPRERETCPCCNEPCLPERWCLDSDEKVTS